MQIVPDISSATNMAINIIREIWNPVHIVCTMMSPSLLPGENSIATAGAHMSLAPNSLFGQGSLCWAFGLKKKNKK